MSSPEESSPPLTIEAEKKSKKSLIYRIYVVSLSFLIYTLIHASRKTFSNAKNTLAEEWSPQSNDSYFYEYDQWNARNLFSSPTSSSFFLGTLDTAFMLSYAFGLYINGILGDRFDQRKFLTVGMMVSSIFLVLFGYVSECLNIYSIPWYIVFWVLNAFFQSIIYPSLVAVLSSWIHKDSRGWIMGIWGSSACAGNILGSLLSGTLVDIGYHYSFLVPALATFSLGFVVLASLPPRPSSVGLTDEVDPPSETLPLVSESSQSVSFWQVLRIPGVISYSLSFASLKFVNYSFFFWLPYYLHDKYNWSNAEADYLSAFYDGGGIIGSIVVGLLSDWMGYRSPVLAIFLFLGCPSIVGYYFSPNNRIINGGLMGTAGFFINGASNLISTAISADLGRHDHLSDSAVSTVTGIIDGTGSVGVALGQILIPLLASKAAHDWSLVYGLLTAMLVVTIICIAKMAWQETRAMVDRWRGIYRSIYPAI
ncbi:SLC37A3 [Cordylochernes scorpioides]|uniref:Sugar phosphate exchanger 3 n=1 Tax=Cordylochernes scorpioides TaxID=51811 RepID=A0ABY6K094_9ARAC|nr:SLC37A3 [Cordylochernes scorpioides]